MKKSNILEKITDIYIFIIIVVFPIIVDKTGYYHILECKWKAFFYIFIFYVLALIIGLIINKIKTKSNYLKTIKLNKIQYSLLIFLIVIFISFLLSPYNKMYNLLIGEGRGEGLVITTFYILSTLLISIFGKFKKKHLVYFSISSILVSLIGILQYLGYNPFYLYKNNLGIHNCFYITTIGNIDTISAYYCLFLLMSFISYIFYDNKKSINLIHLLSLFLGFFLFGIINVSSGKVAIVVVFFLISPILISKSVYLKKSLISLAIFLLAYGSNIFLNAKYYYNLEKIKIQPTFNIIIIMFIIVIIILLLIANKFNKINYDITKNSNKIKKMYLILLGIGLIFLIVVFFIDFHNDILSGMHLLLHGKFNDNIGSYRIFLWKRTLKLVPNYPFFGSGPDSFSIQFMSNFTDDIKRIGPLTVNDTAANVYLTMLINYGIIGLCSYLYFIYLLIKNTFNHSKENKFIVIALICYLIQDFFNLSVVIISPIFWLSMGLIMADLKNDN